jgi:hypothetical protein
MSSFVAQGNASGSGAHTLQSSATNSSITQTLPTVASTTLGYINTPLDAKTANYTVVLGDSGKTILLSSGSGVTFTIDSNANVAYDTGTVLTFINMSSSSLSIAITSDTMYLAGAGSTGTRTLAQYGIATAIKMTSTTWLISGNGLT